MHIKILHANIEQEKDKREDVIENIDLFFAPFLHMKLINLFLNNI